METTDEVIWSELNATTTAWREYRKENPTVGSTERILFFDAFLLGYQAGMAKVEDDLTTLNSQYDTLIIQKIRLEANNAALRERVAELGAALKYSRRFLKPVEHDTFYVDVVLSSGCSAVVTTEGP